MRAIPNLMPVALVIGGLALPTTALAQRAPGGAPSGPVQVGVITLHPQSVPITQQLPGRVSASQTADVRPQVGGVIKAIDFKAGQPVKAGDKLYEIEKNGLLEGMQSMNQSLLNYYKAGVIDFDTAMSYSENQAELIQMLRNHVRGMEPSRVK